MSSPTPVQQDLVAGAGRGVEGGQPGWRGLLRQPGRDSQAVWWCTCRPIHPDRQAARDCAQAELDRRQQPALGVEQVARGRLASLQGRDRQGESLAIDDPGPSSEPDPTMRGGY